MYPKSYSGQIATEGDPPAPNGSGRPDPCGPATPEPARRQRCPAALIADPRPCEGKPCEVRVVDRTGQGTTACWLRGAVLLASLDGARVYSLDGGSTAVVAVCNRAALLLPFDGVWPGPGVQPVSTFEEAAVFPDAPGQLPPGPCFSSSELGNAPEPGWFAGQGYQVSPALGGAASVSRGLAQGVRYEEVPGR